MLLLYPESQAHPSLQPAWPGLTVAGLGREQNPTRGTRRSIPLTLAREEPQVGPVEEAASHLPPPGLPGQALPFLASVLTVLQTYRLERHLGQPIQTPHFTDVKVEARREKSLSILM